MRSRLERGLTSTQADMKAVHAVKCAILKQHEWLKEAVPSDGGWVFCFGVSFAFEFYCLFTLGLLLQNQRFTLEQASHVSANPSMSSFLLGLGLVRPLHALRCSFQTFLEDYRR